MTLQRFEICREIMKSNKMVNVLDLIAQFLALRLLHGTNEVARGGLKAVADPESPFLVVVSATAESVQHRSAETGSDSTLGPRGGTEESAQQDSSCKQAKHRSGNIPVISLRVNNPDVLMAAG